MADQGNKIASFGLKVADPTIPWPQKAETTLADRPGWTRGRLKVRVAPGSPDEVDAILRREFAVHRMIDGEGFATTFVADGKRIHCGGMVFARSADAMTLVEELQELCPDWHAAFASGITPQLRRVFVDAHERAERDGKIMLNIVTHANL
ncbi:MAG: hypothetical protein DI606_04305 [Sphingobium sp.]|uniref:hypothetical protein n=1 Tax=Sphingobium sp. TaxID=1912891 RepID=UPI000DB59E42|nr:hypothetical protein [Sphingobium sp.]PZU13796.1 MAG: hypothetical protein DI606_04305 [Sphingobium sp.]